MRELIYTCRACSKKNKIVGPVRRIGFYKCGSCGAELLRREIVYHEKLVMDVRRELAEIETSLQEVRSSLFRRQRVSELRNKFRHSTSRFQNWRDSVEYIRDSAERELILKSYSPDLMVISESANRIIVALDEKDWLKRKMAANPELRHLIALVSDMLGLVAGVLSLLGIGGSLVHMLGNFNRGYIEEGPNGTDFEQN